MRFNQAKDIKEIALEIHAHLIDDSDGVVWGINEIHKVEPGDITFVDHPKYYNKSLQSAATFIIIDKEVPVPSGKALLVVDNPFEAYKKLSQGYRKPQPILENNHSKNKIHPSVIIEKGAIIGHDVSIDEGSYIGANVVINNNTIIGKNVTIQSGCQIANDAFYYKKTEAGYQKWISLGRVIIHDNVEIGTLSTIIKGVSGDTIIGEGSKFDANVHIGHGAVIGKNCLIASQTAIAGKVTIGDDCVIYGQVGIAQNVTIGDRAILLAKTGAARNLKGDMTYYGVPAEDVRIKYRELTMLKQMRKK